MFDRSAVQFSVLMETWERSDTDIRATHICCCVSELRNPWASLLPSPATMLTTSQIFALKWKPQFAITYRPANYGLHLPCKPGFLL